MMRSPTQEPTYIFNIKCLIINNTIKALWKFMCINFILKYCNLMLDTNFKHPQTCLRLTVNFLVLTFTASWRIWLIVFGPLSMKALRGTQLFSRSSTVSCSRKRILAGNSLLFIKDRIRPKYWSIKDWRRLRGGVGVGWRGRWESETARGLYILHDSRIYISSGCEPVGALGEAVSSQMSRQSQVSIWEDNSLTHTAEPISLNV